VALRESRVRKNPNYDDVCFHCQQCIEKYLKAALVIKGRTVEKIHDLATLLRECVHDFPLWSALSRDVDLLSQYAVLFRYPGQTATKERSRQAVEAMRRCRAEIRSVLGMETDPAKKRRTKR
jgi:HEPN domain-containing protein